MVKKNNEFPEDIIDFEDLFQNDYKNMNKFISFFKKVQEVFDTFKDVRIKELNLSKTIPETSDILPFTYIITINSKEYLLFLINESKKYISKSELLIYKNIFTYNPSQVGIIIVWNDLILSSLKLYRSEIYKQYEEIIEILSYKERLLPLPELLKKEIIRKEELSRTVKTPVKDIQERKALNLSKEFEKVINEVLSKYKSKRFRGVKKDVIMQINEKEISTIIDFFANYLLDNYSRKDIKNKFKKIGKSVK